jgi:hypothetical protein
MTRSEALSQLRDAGFWVRYEASDDPCCDDEFFFDGGDTVAVQILATRDGLRFVGAVYSGEGDDFGVTHGPIFADPVQAAESAFDLATVLITAR